MWRSTNSLNGGTPRYNRRILPPGGGKPKHHIATAARPWPSRPPQGLQGLLPAIAGLQRGDSCHLLHPPPPPPRRWQIKTHRHIDAATRTRASRTQQFLEPTLRRARTSRRKLQGWESYQPPGYHPSRVGTYPSSLFHDPISHLLPRVTTPITPHLHGIQRQILPADPPSNLPQNLHFTKIMRTPLRREGLLAEG